MKTAEAKYEYDLVKCRPKSVAVTNVKRAVRFAAKTYSTTVACRRASWRLNEISSVFGMKRILTSTRAAMFAGAVPLQPPHKPCDALPLRRGRLKLENNGPEKRDIVVDIMARWCL